MKTTRMTQSGNATGLIYRLLFTRNTRLPSLTICCYGHSSETVSSQFIVSFVPCLGKSQMFPSEYPENFVEHLVRDSNDTKYGQLLAPGERSPGGSTIDGVRIPPDELLARTLAMARTKMQRPITWQGPINWRTQHGHATLAWHCGNPNRAWNALLADGRRVKAAKLLHGPLWRRTADGPPKKYQWGELKITDGDVVFTDVGNSSYEPPVFEGKPNLESDLAANAAFVGELADIPFALAAVAEFNQGDYVRIDGEQNADQYFRRDEAAYMVAGLRGVGEELSDFDHWDVIVPQAEMTALRAKVRAHLRRMGWRPEFE
jgi:hypothetical protein